MVQTEIRIDCANLTDDEVKHAKEETQTLFRFNKTPTKQQIKSNGSTNS